MYSLGGGGFPGNTVVRNPPSMQELQEKQVQSLVWKDSLEEGMAAHSSIIAWRIPWTEEPGGLQGSIHRVAQSQTQPKRLRVCLMQLNNQKKT